MTGLLVNSLTLLGRQQLGSEHPEQSDANRETQAVHLSRKMQPQFPCSYVQLAGRSEGANPASIGPLPRQMPDGPVRHGCASKCR